MQQHAICNRKLRKETTDKKIEFRERGRELRERGRELRERIRERVHIENQRKKKKRVENPKQELTFICSH